MKMRSFVLSLFLLFVLFLQACTPQAKVVVWVPPVMKLSGVEHVVIIPFRPARWGDRQGFILADHLRRYLNGSDARRFVRSHGAQELPSLLRKALLQRAVTDVEIRNFLRHSKRKAFVAGRILSYDFTQQRLRRRRLRRYDRDSYNISGAPPMDHYADRQRTYANSFCLQRQLKVSAEMWMVDIRFSEPEATFYTMRTTTLKLERCGEAIGTLLGEGAMAQIAYRNLAELLADPMIPHRKELLLPLERDANDPLMKQGLVFAEQAKWEAAEKLWRKALARRPRDPKVWYNLGVAAEVQGLFLRALTCYKNALAIVPSARYQDAWDRVSRQQALLQEMRKKYALKRRR